MRRVKHRFFCDGGSISSLRLGLFAVCLMAAGYAAAQTNVAGTVAVAGVYYNDPPYHFVDSEGLPAGFDIDLLKAAAAATGLEIRIRMGTPDDIRSALATGGVSMVAGTFQTAEIADFADFCTPYILVRYSLFAGSNTRANSPDGISGRSVVVRRGDGIGLFVRTNNFSDRIVEVDSYEDALNLVAFGHYDFALLPTDRGQYSADQYMLSSMVKSVGKPVCRSGYGFVVAKGEKALLDRLNQGLSRIITEGKYKEIESRWLANYTGPQARTAGFLYRNRLGLATAGLALLASFVVANLLMRRKVSVRTTELTATIRDSRKANDDLRAEIHRMAAILGSAPFGIMVLTGWDWESEVLYCNTAFVNLFGYEQDVLPTFRSLANLIFPDDEYRNRLQARWNNLGEQSSSGGGFTLSASTMDGKKRHIDFRAVPIGDGRVVVMFSDVTEKELMEEERQRVDEQIRQSQKLEAMGQLAGGVSHDLNNLLAPILGNAQLLLMELGADKDKGVLAQEIVSAAKRAGELTKQLLAYARKGKFQVIQVDIHSSIHEVTTLLQRSIDKLIEVKEDLQAAKPVIMGDPTQINGAFLNLGVNARDAMPNGGQLIFSTRMITADKEICRRLSHEITPGEYLQVRVSDTGTGMTKEVRQRLFEPFFTTKQIGKGTGLGLAAVFGCVKNHHGTITVESEPGKGTTFSILLPAVGKATTEEKKEAAFTQGTGHVLIIDDEETVRRFLGRTLEKLGYRVSLCQDGVAGVEFYKNNFKEIDLVILDMIMPNLDGKGALTQLKKINPAINALIVSGYSTDKTAVECMKLGARGFLAKPCQIDELARSVSLCIGAGIEQTEAILK
ncbi:MAG: transporter substrate-binding domain-containing protein [bacterium]